MAKKLVEQTQEETTSLMNKIEETVQISEIEAFLQEARYLQIPGTEVLEKMPKYKRLIPLFEKIGKLASELETVDRIYKRTKKDLFYLLPQEEVKDS